MREIMWSIGLFALTIAMLSMLLLGIGEAGDDVYWIKSNDIVIDADAGIGMRNAKMAKLQSEKKVRLWDAFAVKEQDGNLSALRMSEIPGIMVECFLIFYSSDQVLSRDEFDGDSQNSVISVSEIQRLYDTYKAEGTIAETEPGVYTAVERTIFTGRVAW